MKFNKILFIFIIILSEASAYKGERCAILEEVNMVHSCIDERVARNYSYDDIVVCSQKVNYLITEYGCSRLEIMERNPVDQEKIIEWFKL